MKTTCQTKKQLNDELEALRKRVRELETIEMHYEQLKQDYGERVSRCFTPMEQREEAIYVIFDRKYEFVNQKFAEMFDVEPEEVCNPGFDPMMLIAPESRRFIMEKYREGIRGDFKAQQYKFTGLTKGRSRVECDNFVLFIPYKWGLAMHGMIRDIASHPYVDKEITAPRCVPIPLRVQHFANPLTESRAVRRAG